MIYNIANTSEVGKSVRIFDADGVEHRCCLEVDTESGRIERIIMGPDGKLIIDETGEAVKRETIMAPAPLKVVPA